MDDADLADKRIADAVESARNEAAYNLRHAAQATGHCLNCGEKLDDGRRWCDSDCSCDWSRRTGRPL